MSTGPTDPAWPVIVNIEETGITAALMNRKAYRKSLESGSAWVVHPVTGRVLPWPGNPRIVSLEEAPGCFMMKLPEHSAAEPYGSEPPLEADPDDRSVMGGANGAQGETGDAAEGAAVMDALSRTIAERHQAMPQGSYTTHLFDEGLDKIRKKTGEEAVELLLARENDDVVFESADLVYHLLVLLEASGLTWEHVTAELARRHGA